MSSLTTTLNASLVAGDAARLAQAQQLQAQEEAVASKLRQASALRGVAANSTITASYTYKVGSDGALIPTETKITTQVDPDAAKQASNRRYNNANSRNSDGASSLRNITRPKAELNPGDEVRLFAKLDTSRDNQQTTTVASLSVTIAEANVPATPPSTLVTLAAQAQLAAAKLYARNSDAVYNVNPLVDQAA